MAGKDYLPKSDSEFSVWFQNFVAKLPTHAASVGITPAQVTQFQTDSSSVQAQINTSQSAKTTWLSAVQQKDAIMFEVQKRLRDAVIVLKRNAGYTDAIGQDLGVVPSVDGRSPSIRLAQVKPTFQAMNLPDMVRLDWVKGESDGVVVQCKRGNEANFATLDKDTKSPYDDTRRNLTPDQPETRIYRMRYLSGDQEVGPWSDEARVLCLI
ncbi:MAG: hypothetical protein HY033_11955 [Ignavibacteriae bacterium]|nr:hypothetical protein [Ignavibacteriota bacterium]